MKSTFGKVDKQQDGFTVTFERIFNHSIDTVWDAISNPEKLKIWFTDFEMELKPGSPLKILFRDEARTVTHGEIIEVIPPTKFVWTWEGELAVWELTKLGEKQTRLVFTYSKMDDKYAVGAAGGFHTIVDRLEKMLNGSLETYPFGTEENDPVQLALREEYGNEIYQTYPYLQVHNPIKLEKILPAGIAAVWDAISNRDSMKQWYFDIPEFRAEPGAVFKWEAGPPEGKQWLHEGRITEVIPEKKLAHTWKYPGYEGEALAIWEMTEIDENTTKLNFRFEILTPFDLREEELARKNFVEGWAGIINGLLVDYLGKKVGRDYK